MNEANIYRNDDWKANSNLKVYDNFDPDFSKEPHTLENDFKPWVGKQPSSPLKFL